MVKNLPTMWKTQVRSLGQEDPPEKEMATHSSILAWRIHGQRSLVGYSPWGHKESDTTERLTTVLFIIGRWGLPLDSVVFVSGEVNFEGRDREEPL